MFKLLIDQLTSGDDPSLRPLVDQFVALESKIQQTPNPSGDVNSGGLGEPKFNIDGTAFTKPWGRPQRGKRFRLHPSLFRLIDWTELRWSCSPRDSYDNVWQLAA